MIKKIMGKTASILMGGIVGATAGGVAMSAKFNKKLNAKNVSFNKLVTFYYVYDRWLILKQQGKSLVEYFERNQYKTLAIYGMKELGERLYDELKDSGITVKYIIDRNAESIYADVDVVPPDDDLEPVDVIVVTAVTYFDEIEEMLSEKVDYPVVSLEDILYEV